MQRISSIVLAVMLWLLTNAAVRSGEGDINLYAAVDTGDMGAIEGLLKRGTNVDARNPTNGWTPLINAANRGAFEAAKLLLSHGADVNARTSSKSGSTVLLFAISSENLKLVTFLLDHGAHINAPAKDGNTPLYFAVSRGQFETATLLLDRGADPNQHSFRNDRSNVFTPLMKAVLDGNTNMVALLLAKGADLEKRNNRGHTVLMEAAGYSNPAMVQYLIARGAQINTRGHRGHTAIMYAALNGQSKNLKLLLQAGADPLAKASDLEEPDWSPNYGAEKLAQDHGHHEALKIILEAQRRASPSP